MYKRILLKLSGEALLGSKSHGVDMDAVTRIVREIKQIQSQVSDGIVLVIGGGNIYRGSEGSEKGMHQAVADHMGMLATVMNAIVLREVFTREGVEARVLSALPVTTLCELYTRDKALHHLGKKRIVICGGGTGNPFFTTDTTAALRALELNCDVILKATKVDGVYNADPMKDKTATKFDTLTYTKALSDHLQVMDNAALSLCRDHNLPIVVFNLFESGTLTKAVTGKATGTTIRD